MALVNGGLGGGDVIPPQPSGGGAVDSVVAGTGISIDDAVPASPVVSVVVSDWIPLTLSGTWEAYGSPFAAPSYRLTPDGEHVELAGVVRGGVLGSAIATLPAGYTPMTVKTPVSLDASTAVASFLSISPTGPISPSGTSSQPVLDLVVFPIDI